MDKFEIVESLGELSRKKNGDRKELNLVSWFGREPKFDIREWSEDHKTAKKGITFTAEELEKLKSLLEELI